jgi:hypothetical protein
MRPNPKVAAAHPELVDTLPPLRSGPARGGSMSFLYGRAGRLIARNDGFRPGQAGGGGGAGEATAGGRGGQLAGRARRSPAGHVHPTA